MNTNYEQRLKQRGYKQVLYGISFILLGLTWMTVEISGISVQPLLENISDKIIAYASFIGNLIGDILFPLILLLIGVAIIAKRATNETKPETFFPLILNVFFIPLLTAILSIALLGWSMHIIDFIFPPYITLSVSLPFLLVSFINWVAEKFIPLFNQKKYAYHE